MEHEDVCCGSRGLAHFFFFLITGLAHLGSFGSDFNGFYLEWVLEI